MRRRTTWRSEMTWRRCLHESLESRVALSATPTEISVAASSNQAVYGQAITLTATVEAATTLPSEGTVSFMDGGNLLGTASVSSGTATLTNVVLNAGNHSITASYTDSLGNYAASSTTPQANSLVTTVAGDGVHGSGGINGPATSAELSWPEGVVVDSAGDLFIADWDNNRVLEVYHATGAVTTVAGNGTYGYSGDGGLATAAELRLPSALALDASGNLFIADTSNNCVREVNHATGIISTVAGMGPTAYGYSGDGGPATAAKLFYPAGLSFDSAGDLLIADQANDRVREVNATTGIITTVAGNGSATDTGDGGAATSATVNYPQGLAFDSAGDLFIADYHGCVVREIHSGTGIITTVAGNGILGRNGEGGPATSAELDYPSGIAVAPGGTLYIADSGSNRILEVDPLTGIITTVAGNESYAYGGDGGPAGSSKLYQPNGIAFDSAGDLFFDDTWNNRVREISNGTLVSITPASLTITAQNQTKIYGAALPTLTDTYSGFVNGDSVASLATQPTLSTTATATSSVAGGPYAITVSGAADANYAITYVNGSLTVTPASTAITVAASSTQAVYGQAITLTATVEAATTPPSEGTVSFMDGGNLLGTASVSSGTATLANVTLNAGNHSITASYSDSPSNYEDSSTTPQANSLIETVAGNGNWGYAGDGGAATSAKLNYPRAVAVDAAGDVFIADTDNSVIREVSHATGRISTVAGNGMGGYTGDGGAATSAELDHPSGIAVDSSGDLFIADTYNSVVREVNHSTGIITTVAGNRTAGPGYTGDGGEATSAQLHNPYGIAVDSSGDLFIADYINNVVREVSHSTGIITTVAGNGAAGFSGDGGTATAAELNEPYSIAVDSSGNLFIADAQNDRIREVDHATGDINTVAGDGTAGFSGDGGAATAAELNLPFGIALDSTGNLFIGDFDNNRVREVVRSTGNIITVAGDGTGGFAGDGGGASSAEIDGPTGVTVDSNGNLFFADNHNQRVREVVNGASVSVTPATLTITVDNQSKDYGTSMPTLTATYSGFVNGETMASLTTLPTFSTTATDGSSVGSYAITAGGATDTNYTISYVNGLLTVTPAALTITADNQTKTVGTPLPMLTASYSGFVNGDTAASLTMRPTLATTATAGSPVGAYTITASAAADPNYTISYVNGTLTIVPLPVANDDVYVIGSGRVTVAASNGLLANDTPSGGISVTAGSVTGVTGGTFTFHADGSFTYAPPADFAGYDHARYTVIDSLGDTSTANVTVLSQAGGAVWKFYETVLGRNPDDAGLRSWIADLAHGGSTGDMAVAFAESDELLDQSIGGYYQQYLGRAADPAGLNGLKLVWRTAGGPEWVQAYMAASPEFFQKAGGTMSGWLTALYERVLNRTPDSTGFNYWLQRLASGTTKAAVVLAFLDSPEAVDQDVTTWFQQDFDVKPSSNQLSFFVAEMLSGSSDATIEHQLASLPAYFSTVPAAPPGAAARLPDYLSWH